MKCGDLRVRETEVAGPDVAFPNGVDIGSEGSVSSAHQGQGYAGESYGGAGRTALARQDGDMLDPGSYFEPDLPEIEARREWYINGYIGLAGALGSMVGVDLATEKFSGLGSYLVGMVLGFILGVISGLIAGTALGSDAAAFSSGLLGGFIGAYFLHKSRS